MTFPYPDSPFGEGQRAYDAGKPIDTNPYPEAPVEPDDYPGDRQLWWKGWNTMKHMRGI